MSRYRSTQKYLIAIVSIATLLFGVIGVVNSYLPLYANKEPLTADINNLSKNHALRDEVEHRYGLNDHLQYELMIGIKSLYIIPGGGSSNSGAYPAWTQRRVIAAHDHYLHSQYTQNESLFITLSAGSLNAPNAQISPPRDQRILFECQHVINHLKQLGVSKDRVFGDFFSWDTVTNAMTLRLMVESLLALQDDSGRALSSSSPSLPSLHYDRKNLLQLHVFISDFHAERVSAAFDWVLGLSPSLLPAVHMVIHNVSSTGIAELSTDDLARRLQHELAGVEHIRKQKQQIQTIQQFNAFLLWGGHKGLHSYLHMDYIKSKGAGW